MGVTARALGILGVTFDPVHVGHLAVGEVALRVLDLERVLFMPAGRPPHKGHLAITDAVHREAMLRLAIASSPNPSTSRPGRAPLRATTSDRLSGRSSRVRYLPG